MGWLRGLFTTTDSAGKALDAAIKSGDKLFYTDEEKADFSLKVKGWYLNLLDSIKPFNVAMRLLAVGVFSAWALHLFISTGLYVVAIIYCDPLADMCLIAQAAEKVDLQMTSHINDNFATIIMFYFGAAGLNSAIVAARGTK